MLTDGALIKLYDFTLGVPRTIVMVCNEILHVLARQNKRVADTPEIDEAIQRFDARKSEKKETE